MVWVAQKGWVENPLATIQAEWQGKIDRVETLPDGRTVAIATPDNPEAEALLRVLELNSQGEWVSYIPQVESSKFYLERTENGIRKNVETREWVMSLPIPELTIPISDKSGQPMPLGYLGEVDFGFTSGRPDTGFVFSGIWGGCRLDAGGFLEAAIFVPTLTGDYQVFGLIYDDYGNSANYIGIFLGHKVDTAALARGEFNMNEFHTEAKFDTQMTRADFGGSLGRFPVGAQVGFIVLHHKVTNDVDLAQNHQHFLEIIQGKIPPDNEFMIAAPAGMIISQDLEAMLDD